MKWLLEHAAGWLIHAMGVSLLAGIAVIVLGEFVTLKPDAPRPRDFFRLAGYCLLAAFLVLCFGATCYP